MHPYDENEEKEFKECKEEPKTINRQERRQNKHKSGNKYWDGHYERSRSSDKKYF